MESSLKSPVSKTWASVRNVDPPRESMKSYQQELSTIGVIRGGLERVGNASGEEPQVTFVLMTVVLFWVRTRCTRERTTVPMKFWPAGLTAVT